MSEALNLTFARPNALWLLMLIPVVGLLGLIFGVRQGKMARGVVALRLAIVALLAICLAEPLIAQGGDANNTIFVVDRSLSVSQNNAGPISHWLSAAMDSAGGGDRAAVIYFDADASLAAPVGPAREVRIEDTSGSDSGSRNYTDLESALALARSLPVGGNRRIVVISDGAENIGSALNQVGQAATDGTPIDVVLVPGVTGDDLRVDGVSVPNAIWNGDEVNVVASVASGAGGAAEVVFTVDGVEKSVESVTLDPGINTFTLQALDLSPGFHSLNVAVRPGGSGEASPAADVYGDNNSVPLAVVVRGAPRILIVASSGSDPRVKSVLEAQGSDVTTITPDQISSQIPDLSAYDAIVLDNVPAQEMTIDQVTALREVTRTQGKGLIVIGGTNSYGPGNYAGTILEDTLPVTVKVTDGKERPRVALLLIIDRSGSMTSSPISKIDMAKEAARLATESLSDGDQIGILTFSDAPVWAAHITTIDGQSSRDQIYEAIDGIKADGGTQIYGALDEGFDAIRNTDADVRHVVLLTDGKSSTGTPDSYQKLIEDAVGDRTTLSTIAIGDDADKDQLQQIAGWGRGRYSFAEKPEDIPRLTLQEAQSAGSQSVIRTNFQPIQTLPSPIMAGFDPLELPQLDGYDFAQAKPQAQVILTSTRDDPVLAVWQLGLGRVVAWTADDGADLAAQWRSWDRYGEFWGSVVRWALPDPENRAISVATERQGDQAVVTITSQGSDGDYVDLSTSTVAVTGPDGTVNDGIGLYQSGPGEYQFRVKAPEVGSYRLEIGNDGTAPINEVAGFTMPPSPELQPDPDAAGLMRAIASRTGGRMLNLDDAGAVFDAPGAPGTALRSYQAVWFIPLAAALGLLLVELAMRLSFVDRLRGLRLAR